ncbi:hypothetical protein C6Q18_24810 [Pseudomonas chlororaphis subsp. piscium]|nr:hypothetical protein C6Q18_24810 [Pseudomonas chlororaphis subsp. piscium]
MLALFCVCISCYGGCAREVFGPAGFLLSRFTNLRTAATHSLGNERGSSIYIGASRMEVLTQYLYLAISSLPVITGGAQ